MTLHQNHTWQLQDAKTHFSKLVKQAMTKGPQNITVRGEPAVVLISKTEFDQLRAQKKTSLPVFMQQSPLATLDLELPRDRALTREVDDL